MDTATERADTVTRTLIPGALILGALLCAPSPVADVACVPVDLPNGIEQEVKIWVVPRMLTVSRDSDHGVRVRH